MVDTTAVVCYYLPMDETKTDQITSRHAERPIKGRVFTNWKTEDVEPEPTGPLCSDPSCGPCNFHERHGGQREVDHKVWKAFNRRVTQAWRKELVQLLAEHFGCDSSEVKVRFSVNAGCGSCPCSPGWIIESGHGWARSVFINTRTYVKG